VATAATQIGDAVLPLLGHKPHEGLAAHSLTAVGPWI
jgi:hypothetical protein